MSNPKLRLYVDSQFMSPYALSVFVALREKGLVFDVEGVNLEARQHLHSAYQARSLTARVPVLEQGELTLSESSAITEYLEDVFPPPTYVAVYPQEPVARARARQVQAWLRSDLMPIREERPTSVIFRSPGMQPLSEKAQASVQKLFRVSETLLEKHGTSFFGQWCIADTDLALMLNRLIANGDDVPAKLATYVQHQWQRPSVQAWVELSRRNKSEFP